MSGGRVDRFSRLPQVDINPAGLTNVTLAGVHAYWLAKRGARSMPARADLDPAEMKPWLPWIVLMDVRPDLQDFRYRLIGSSVVNYFMADNTGGSAAECFGRRDPEVAKSALRLFRKVARDHLVVRTMGQADWLGREYLDFEALHLPLSDDDKLVNMLLVVFTFDERRIRALRLIPLGLIGATR
jgi:hypothetical protein